MPTNFPTSLDTLGAGGTLGGPFIDAAPPVDLFEDIAADFRSNTNDALLAVEARVGLTNSTDPGSFSWATVSVGGVNNLGLRFAQEETEWPGLVAESGIFLKDVTFEPMFHRAGEAKATFYSMINTGDTLQAAYDTSGSPAQIAMSGTKNLLFNTHSGGAAFVVADEANTSFFISADEVAGELSLGTGATLKILLEGQIASNMAFDGAAPRSIENSDDLTLQTVGAFDLNFLSGKDISLTATGETYASVGAASAFQINTSAIPSTNTGGMVQVTHDVGADGVTGVHCTSVNLVGNNGREFSAYRSTVTNASDLDSNDVISGYEANLDMQGDAPGAGISFSAAVHAKSSVFTGANFHLSTGLYVDTSYDLTFYSNTGGAWVIWGADSETFRFDATSITGGNTESGGLIASAVRTGSQSSVFKTTSTVQESVGNGGDQLGGTAHLYRTYSNLGDFSNPLLAAGVLTSSRFDHRMDATDSTTAWHEAIRVDYIIPSSGGGGVNDQGSSAYGAYVDIPESISAGDGLYHNNDGTFTFSRWAFYVAGGESHFRRTEFTGPSDLGKALVRLDQNDNVAPFYELDGREDNNPATPNCNLTTTNVGSAVIGPLDTTWSFLGMYQVYVIDAAAAIPSGHYWVPLYEAV